MTIEFVHDFIFNKKSFKEKLFYAYDIVYKLLLFAFGFAVEVDIEASSHFMSVSKASFCDGIGFKELVGVLDQSAAEKSSSSSVSTSSSFVNRMTEEDQIKLVINWFKSTRPRHKFINTDICNFVEADLLLRYEKFLLIFECKRSMTHESRNKGRKQLLRLCKGFRAWEDRVIGVLYSPVGYEIVCDFGDKNVDISIVLPALSVAQNYSSLISSRIVSDFRDDVDPLESQSGIRSYMEGKKNSDSPMSDGQQKINAGGFPSIFVDAATHHLSRMRASKPSNNSWSMNKIFDDTNTIKSDQKFIREKFADEQRMQFAAPGSASCDSKQVTPIQNLMKEMKISVSSGNGMSFQDEVQTSPDVDNDIGV
jgi:hypothetical protein